MDVDGFFDKGLDMSDFDPNKFDFQPIDAGKTATDFSLDTIGERATSSVSSKSLLGREDPGFFKSVVKYANDAVGELANSFSSGKNFGKYVMGKGDEFISMATGQLASAGAQRAVFGKPEVGNQYNNTTVIPDLPMQSYTASDNTGVASALDYYQNAANGYNYGANSVFNNWMQFAIDPEQTNYQPGVMNA